MEDFKAIFNNVIDWYAVKARLAPVVVVVLPPALTVAGFFPRKMIGWDLLAWLGALALLAVFLEQLARDGGKKRQEKLWEDWGGQPSAALLRWQNDDLTPVERDAYRANLERLMVDITLPTREEEEADAEAADQVYLRCTDWLRTHTRDQVKFRLLLEENRNYGFRRNLYGMKAIASVLLAVSLILLIIDHAPLHLNPLMWPPVAKVAFLVDLGMIIAWGFVIKPDWVKVPAEAYALQLLKSSDLLVSELPPRS